MNTFFAFAIADSMFPANSTATRVALSFNEFVQILKQGVNSCCNSSHAATIAALNSLLANEGGVKVEIPDTPPMVQLNPGDRIVVMSVRGLPRLTDNRHYTDEEIKGAKFVFGLWSVEK